MEKKNIYPKNKRKFIRLMKFGKEIVDICKRAGINPIVYGSLAFFYYTKKKDIKVNDIDFLIPEDSFDKIIEILKKKKIKYVYSPEWHTLQIFKGDLKIELDSTDFWQKDLPKNFKRFNFNNLEIRAVALKSLIKIYKKASEVSKDNPEGNRKKYEMLKKLK